MTDPVAPAPAPAPAPASAPGSDPAARIQAELAQMSGSAEGLLALAALATIVVYVLFNVALVYGAASWEAVVAAALILLARFMPSSPAGGLSGKTAMFTLGFVIFGFAALSLVSDVRNLRGIDAIPMVGELLNIAAGTVAGFALFRMLK